MTDDPRNDQDARLADALSRLHPEVEPPPAVEDRLVGALRARGDITARRRGPRWLVPLGIAAAALLAYVLLRRPAPADNAEPQFLLLIAEDNRYTPPADSVEARARVAEYTEWAGRLAGAGKLISAGELAYAGTGCARRREVPFTHRLASRRGVGILPGTCSIAGPGRATPADSPHLKYGGTVVVRAVLH